MVAKSGQRRTAGRFRRWIAVIALGAIVLLGMLTLTSNTAVTPLSAQVSPPAAAFVPQDALFTAAIAASPEAVSAGLEAAGLEIAAPLTSLQTALQRRAGIDYERDIAPWLGNEALFAVLPATTSAADPAYTFVLSVAEGDQAREFLELIWQRQALSEASPHLTTVDGAVAFLPDTPSTLWPMALVGDRYLIFASNGAALSRSLRAAQVPELSLTQRRRYRAAIAALPSRRFGLIHVNVPSALEALGLAQPASPHWTDMAVGVAAEQQTVRLHATGAETATKEELPRQTTSAPPVTALPSTVTAVAVGHNLAGLAQSTLTELQAYRRLPDFLTQPQRWLATPTGEAADPVLKAWLTGSYVLAYTATGEVIALTEQTPQAATAINTLDQLAQQQGLTVTPLTVEQQPVTAWTRLRTQTRAVRGQGNAQRETAVETQVVALHTTYQNYDLWTTSIKALADTLTLTGPKLFEQDRFQQAVGRQRDGTLIDLDRNTNYIYLSGAAFLSQLTDLPLLDLVELATQPQLKQLASIVIAPDDHSGSEPLTQVTLRFSKP